MLHWVYGVILVTLEGFLVTVTGLFMVVALSRDDVVRVLRLGNFMTVKELALKTGLNVAQVQRHLNRMDGEGLMVNRFVYSRKLKWKLK